MDTALQTTAAIVTLLWAGMILGVSFLATPVKFKAPSLTFATGIDIGQVTFRVFSRVEWLITALLAVLGVLIQPPLWMTCGMAAVAALVICQAVVLLPRLDLRAAQIVDGATMPPSWHHKAYVALEILKTLVLVVIGGFFAGGV